MKIDRFIPHTISRVSAFVLAMMLCAAAQASPWAEVGDAGSLLQHDGFQATGGTGSLTSISGALPDGSSGTIGEVVDVYGIIIDDPATFFATSDSNFGTGLGDTGNEDTRLFLFDAAFNLVMWNDDTLDNGIVGLRTSSYLSDPSTFNATTGNDVDASVTDSLVAGGTYYLAVTKFPVSIVNPLGGGGFTRAIADPFYGTVVDEFDNLYGPILPIDLDFAWQSDILISAEFSYTIELGGSSPLESGNLPGDVNTDGSVDLADFGILAFNFAPGVTGQSLATGDLDGDTPVDSPDFGILAANHGATASPLVSVPEPGTLASLAVLGLITGRRSRPKRGLLHA